MANYVIPEELYHTILGCLSQNQFVNVFMRMQMIKPSDATSPAQAIPQEPKEEPKQNEKN